MSGLLGCAEVRETLRAEQQPAQAAVLTGPWQQCSSSCGGGWQERAVLCAAAPGFLGEAWQCSGQGLTSTPTSTPCRYMFRPSTNHSLFSGPHMHPCISWGPVPSALQIPHSELLLNPYLKADNHRFCGSGKQFVYLHAAYFSAKLS